MVASWTCRVPMTLDRHNFLPFSLPMWGFAEPNHIHVIPHMNFLFHVQDGFILGASAYPSELLSFFLFLFPL